MPVRGIRGATTAAENSEIAIHDATEELLRWLTAANELRPNDIASIVFSVTPDLNATFPARAARQLGWNDVPLLDTVEIPVPDSLPRCIRVLIHWNTERPIEAIQHGYLRDAAALRPDLAPESGVIAMPVPSNGGKPAAEAPVPPPAPKPVSSVTPSTKTIVAYQGEPGAYSQEAIYQHFGEIVGTLPCHGFEDIFHAIEDGRASHGLLPVENSQAGSINQAYDLLLDHDLRVIGEAKLRVRHCLLVPPGMVASDILRVRSHPQALAQCERYLRTRGWEAVPGYDTAGSARELAASPEPGTAAIASKLAGQTYGLDVLDVGIEDSSENTTRFFILGREDLPPAARNKTSIVFATTHTPGALFHALGEFANRGINLTKIESRPRRNRPWHYVFYVDLDGHYLDMGVGRALSSLLTRAAFVKLLGSYPAAPEASRTPSA
jgi:prephenate dehydratase